MKRFTVRVELHNPQNGEGQALDLAMEAKGFSRLVEAGDGTRYRLPAGEYRMATKRSRSDVRKLARAGAAANACSILVTQGACSWYNLDGLKSSRRPSKSST